MEILLVEDDMTLFNELSTELEQWDFIVKGVDDFGDVLHLFEQINPAIVIMDVKLPKYDGFIGRERLEKCLIHQYCSCPLGIILWIK